MAMAVAPTSFSLPLARDPLLPFFWHRKHYQALTYMYLTWYIGILSILQYFIFQHLPAYLLELAKVRTTRRINALAAMTPGT